MNRIFWVVRSMTKKIIELSRGVVVAVPPREVSKSVGSNGQTVLRLKGERCVRGRRLDVQPSMSATLTPRILMLPFCAARRSGGGEIDAASFSTIRLLSGALALAAIQKSTKNRVAFFCGSRRFRI